MYLRLKDQFLFIWGRSWDGKHVDVSSSDQDDILTHIPIDQANKVMAHCDKLIEYCEYLEEQLDKLKEKMNETKIKQVDEI